MRLRRSVALVDSDVRRRARITHALAGLGVHIEPFEDVAEIRSCWPRAGVLLVHDDGAEIGDLIRAMGEREHWFPVVAFAEAPKATRIVHAILAGAIDYVEWPSAPDELVQILEAAETASEGLRNLKLREARAKARMQRLTPREREVLNGVVEGLSNHKIGKQLSISSRTVEVHRANLMTKMDALHTSEAIRIAIEASLAP